MSTLKEAIANVQGLKNLFKGLIKIEDTLQAAQIAENLAAERQTLIDARTAELKAVTDKIDRVKASEAKRSAEVETAHAARVSVVNTEYENLVGGLAFLKAELARETAEAQSAHDAKGDELANAIRDLIQTRDSLQQSVATLQAELAQLKDRAAKV